MGVGDRKGFGRPGARRPQPSETVERTMRFGPYPRLLVLALAMPELSHALGLGNMRVDSGLNQPLSAQIDIIGASPEDLTAISARLASAEVFQRYDAERPAFLSTTTIVVGADAQGRPVLNIKSTDAFTEPLVNLVIDMRWGHEELIRVYPLLLDPVPTTRTNPVPAAAIANPVSEPVLEPLVINIPKIALPSAQAGANAPPYLDSGTAPVDAAAGTNHEVVAHETLASIARQVGARTRTEQQRTIVAIYRANPDAFAGNMNRLHLGAVLKIPPAAEIQAIDVADANREIRSQTSAWLATSALNPPQSASWSTLSAPVAAAAASPAPAPAPAAAAPDQSQAISAMNRLNGQVQFLEQTLGETNRQLASATARISDFERQAAHAETAVREPAARPLQAVTDKSSVSVMALALTLLAGGLAYGSRFLPVRTQRAKPPEADEPTLEVPALDPEAMGSPPTALAKMTAADVHDAKMPADARSARGEPVLTDQQILEDSATMEMTQIVEIDVSTVEEPRISGLDEPDTIVMVGIEPDATDGTSTALDYNLSDLDGDAHHVEMPGTLRDQVVVVERRKNVVDSLMAAIQRDPTRNDLADEASRDAVQRGRQESAGLQGSGARYSRATPSASARTIGSRSWRWVADRRR